MAKKGGAVQLQIEVDNEEGWEMLVDRDGLILVDIYSDWCGPCGGMLGNLRKVKLEIGGDTLTLATAKCDDIPCLERFRNKSRPTWMFISNKRMIRLMFGANAPRLISTLTEEIKLTKKAIAEKTPREGIDFEQLTEEEQAVADEEARIREEAERIEREAREKAINEKREEIVDNLLEHMKEYNIVVAWPHVGNDGMAQIYSAVKETSMTVGGKPVKYQLTEADLYEMMFYSTWEYSDIEKQELLRNEVTALIFQAPMGDDDFDPINVFLRKIYGAHKAPPGDEESVAVKISTTIKIKIEKPCPEEEEVEGAEEETEEEELEVEGQAQTSSVPLSPVVPVAEATLTRTSKKSTTPAAERKSSAAEDEHMVEVRIPGLHVPENEKCLTLAMRILFPNITQRFELPEPDPIPPHLMCAFDAFKKTEVLQLASEWPEGTMRLGFFTNADPETAQLIAKTADQYNKIHAPPVDAKLIVQVSKSKSEPLLSYCLLGPMYVSPNCVVGEKECELIFPEGYDEPEPEPEPEIVVPKKKKKRGRGSKISAPSKTSDETGESGSAEGGSEEGLEEVDEEEEEEEEEEDDASTMLSMDIEGYRDPTDIRVAVAAEVPPPQEPLADVVAADPQATPEAEVSAEEADKATTTDENPPE